MISRRQFLRFTGFGAFGGAMGAGDAFALEPRFRLTVKEWRVSHPGWPGGAAPLRIAVLTDIHAVEPWMPARRIRAIVDRTNDLRPDVIVLLGDYVNGLRPRYYTAKVPVSEWVAALKPLKAPLGVYAVLGNHDWWSGEAPNIRRAFAKTGIRLLENAAVKIHRDNDAFWIAGLGDQLANSIAGSGAEDLPGTLRRVTDSAPLILLAHEPDIFLRVPPRVTLTLAGHTHGGQVYIPFIGRPAIYAAYGEKLARFAYGHLIEGGRHMVVSSGLGLSNIPVRFLVPPEIAVVTLSSAQA